MMSKSYGEHRTQTATPTVTLTERPEQALFHLSLCVETETASSGRHEASNRVTARISRAGAEGPWALGTDRTRHGRAP